MSRLVFANRFFFPDQSATSRLLSDLAPHLAQDREVVVLCSRQLLEDPAAALAPREDWRGVRIVRLWSTRWGRAWLPGRAVDYLSFLASAAVWALLRLRRGDTAVAKTDPPFLSLALLPGAELHRARLVIWHQDIFPEVAWRTGLGDARGVLARLLGWLRRVPVEAAELNVAISEGMRDFLLRVAPRAHLAVSHNWSADFPPGDDSLREELGLQGCFVVGYSGNLGRAHPVDGLLDAAERLRGQPEIRFLFSGGGAQMERLKADVAARALPGWTFLSYQPADRLAALLRTADVHLTVLDPALEGLILPSKLYGILSASRPVVHLGDPEGEVARLLQRHACGWSVGARDGAALEILLSRLAASPGACANAGVLARQAYVHEYSRAAALGRWAALIGKPGTDRSPNKG